MDEAIPVIEQVLSLVNRYGTALTIVTLLIIAAVKYGPRLIEAHLSFLTTSEETQRRLTKSMEEQAASLDVHRLGSQGHFDRMTNAHDMACRCGHHFCDVLEHVGEKLDIQDRIEDSVGAIRRELERAKSAT